MARDLAPRVVLVLDGPALRRLQMGPRAADVLDRADVRVLAYPPSDPDEPLVAVLDAQGVFRPGAMLVQNPYNTRGFADADTAEMGFAVEKYHVFLRFCAALGASRVELDTDKDTESTSQTTGNAGGAIPEVGSAELSFEARRSKEVKSRLKMRYHGTGGRPDLAAAAALLESARLMGDVTMNALLDLRSLANNEAKEYSFDLNLTSESRGNLKLAASVGAAIPGFDKLFGFSLDRVTKDRADLRVSVKVMF